MKSELVYGRMPVLECLRAGKRRGHKLYLLDRGEDLEAIRNAADGLSVETLPRKDLDRLARGGVHQGVILEADPLPVLDLQQWLARAPAEHTLALLLDGVTDPHNFGAIVRSAAAMGAHGVIFAKDRAAPISPAATKSAAGAMEHIDLVRVTNLVRCIDQLKQQGFWIAALDPDGDRTLWNADLTGRLGLVIGSEGKGIRRLVYESCDLYVRIPLSGPLPSLNASVSAAIALAECLRQRENRP